MKQVTNLNIISELENVIENSNTQPVLIFKHSSTCPLSAYAFHQLMNYLAKDSSGLLCTMVTVQRVRDVSNEIASRLNVQHESPQAILIDKGKVVWHDSHNKITEENLKRETAKYLADEIRL